MCGGCWEPSENWQVGGFRKHDLIRGLAESKLNTIADRISVALNDDKFTEEEFRLILSEVDKFNQMKNDIRGRQKQNGGLSEIEENRLLQRARDEAMIAARTKLLKEIKPEYFLLASLKRPKTIQISKRYEVTGPASNQAGT